MSEVFANDLTDPDEPTGTLDVGIDADDTELFLGLDQGDRFPAAGEFRIRIGSELILVGARTGDTLSSLTQGVEDTDAAIHAVDAQVNLVLTAGALVKGLVTDAVLSGTLGARPAAGVEGRLYFETAGSILYRDNGSSWITASPIIADGFDPDTGPEGGWGYDSAERRWRGWDGLQVGDFQRTLGVQRAAADTLAASDIGTTQTAFATQQVLPAGYLIPLKGVRVSVIGQLTTSASPPTIELQFRVQKAGPVNVVLWRNFAITPNINLTNHGWGFEWIIQAIAAPGAAVGVEAGSVHGALFGHPDIYNDEPQPVTVDTASQQTVQITVQFGAATAGNSVSLRQMLVEEMR